jgi:hypothetical protein
MDRKSLHTIFAGAGVIQGTAAASCAPVLASTEPARDISPAVTYIEEGAAIVASCWLALVSVGAVLCTGVGVHNLTPVKAKPTADNNLLCEFRYAMALYATNSFVHNPILRVCSPYTYTRLAPYFGTPKFAIATFILQQAE